MNSYEEKLLSSWEEVYRQGLLTFWLFVALKGEEFDVATTKTRIAELTNGTYQVADQTLYRVLRKHFDLELVDYREVAGNGGPSKKLYTLSKLGITLLRDFTMRNISLFSQPAVQIIQKEYEINS